MAGADKPRCGSLASKGLPLALRLPATTQLLEPLPSTVPRLLAQSVMSAVKFVVKKSLFLLLNWPLAQLIYALAAPVLVADGVLVGGMLLYTPKSEYSLAKSTFDAGASPGYGVNSCHSCAVLSVFSADKRANSLPQLPPKSSAIMSDQPMLSCGVQGLPEPPPGLTRKI